MTAQTAELRPKSPETLVQFLKLLLMGMLKRLPLKLLLAGGIALLAWIIHTYLLVVTNEGFNTGNSIWLDRILALQGRTIAGSLVWTLAAGLVTSTIARVLAYGFGNTVKGIVETPRHIWDWANELGVLAIPFLIVGYFFTIIFGFFTNNGLLIIQIWLVVLGILIARHTSVLMTILRLGWSDAQKMAKRDSLIPFNLAWPGMFFLGVLVGLLAILPSKLLLSYVCGCLGFLLIILVSVGLFVRSQGGTKGVVGKNIFLWILIPALLTFFVAVVTPAFADDGGWVESGGTLSGWLRSPGAARAVAMGILPAAGSGLGVLFGTALGSAISILGTTGLTANPLSFQSTSSPASTIGKHAPESGRTADHQAESYQYQQGQAKAPEAKSADPPPQSRTADHQAEQFQQQGQADSSSLSDRHRPTDTTAEPGSGMRSDRASSSDSGAGLRADRASHDAQPAQSRTGQGAGDPGSGQRDVRGVDPQSSGASGAGSGSAADSADRATNLDPDKPTDQLSDRHRPETPDAASGPLSDRNQPGGLAERQRLPEQQQGQLASQRQPDSLDAADVKSAGIEQDQLQASRHDPATPEGGPLSTRHDPDAPAPEGGSMRARRYSEDQPGPSAERFTAKDTLDEGALVHSRSTAEPEPKIPLPPIPILPVTLGWDLVVVRTPAGSGLEVQQRLPLAKQTKIGRHGDIDIKILDPKVSRQHALVVVEADTCTLTDLGSSNGTFINGKKMTTPQPLQPGDAVKIGDTYFVVEQRPE